MDEDDIAATLVDEGFEIRRMTVKVIEFGSTQNGRVVYLERKVGMPATAKLVVHPDHDTRFLEMLNGVIVAPAGEFHHHSNMVAFPARRHGGKAHIHYGKAVLVDSIPAAKAVASSLHGRLSAASLRL